MKKIITYTMHESIVLQNIGFALVRTSFGVVFFILGYNKLMSGSSHLTQIGSAIELFGITHGYTIWGYLAALTELCAGASYALGLFTRITSLPLIFLLIVALQFHLQKNDPFTSWAFALTCLCVVCGFLIAGSGMYSVDHFMQEKR